MDKNIVLYNAAIALVEASKFINEVDREFGIIMLDKAEELKRKIHIDEKENKEIVRYKQLIEKD